MNFEDLKTNIHNKIKNDELEDVIKLLISNFSNSNYFNELLQQSANINKLNGDRRKNLMSYDQQMIERSKIRNSIIELFDNIEQELNGEFEQIDSSYHECFKNSKIHAILSKNISDNEPEKCYLTLLQQIFSLDPVGKNYPEFHQQNLCHFNRRLSVVEKVISENTLESLNSMEIVLLLIGIYLYDIIILYEKKDLNVIFEKVNDRFSEDYAELFDNLSKFSQLGKDEASATIVNALTTKYLKENYNERINLPSNQALIDMLCINNQSFYDDIRLIVEHQFLDIFDLLARETVGFDCPDKYRKDKLINEHKVNLQFIALCLRISDLLSFNYKYFPLDFYTYFKPNGEITYQEFLNHLNVNYWTIDEKYFHYEVVCTHPVYQFLLLNYLNKIQDEVDKAISIQKDTPDKYKRFSLKIKHKINQSYVTSKDYIYGPFKFDLQYNNIIQLLMGEELYGDKDLAIRELLQNAIDACHHRMAEEKLNGNHDYKPEIRVDFNDDVYPNILTIQDNGIGMNEDIIQNHFMKIGSSYYKSKKFKELNQIYESKGVDFDHISRFGIGILSTFMIANDIEVKTLRYDISEKQEAIHLNIQSNDKFFVIKKVNKESYGTSITLKLNFDLESLRYDDDYSNTPIIHRLLKRFLVHVNVPIYVNGKHLEMYQYDKDYLLKNIDKNMNVLVDTSSSLMSRIKQDQIILHEVNLSNPKFNQIRNLEGKIYFLFLKDSQGNYCYHTNNLSFTSNCTIIDYSKLGDSIKNYWNKRLNKDLKNKLQILLNNIFGEKFILDIFINNSTFSQEFNNYFLSNSSFFKKLQYIKKDVSFKHIINEFFFPMFITSAIANMMQFMAGLITSNGILIASTFRNSSFHRSVDIHYFFSMPHLFDINFIRYLKPSLKASRNGIIKDKKYKEIKKVLNDIVAIEINELLTLNKITPNLRRRHEFLYELDNDIFISLIDNVNFINKLLLLKLDINGQYEYYTLEYIMKHFNQEIIHYSRFSDIGKDKVRFAYFTNLTYDDIESINKNFKEVLINFFDIELQIDNNYTESLIHAKINMKKKRHEKNYTVKYKLLHEEKVYVTNIFECANLKHPLITLYYQLHSESVLKKKVEKLLNHLKKGFKSEDFEPVLEKHIKNINKELEKENYDFRIKRDDFVVFEI